MEVYYTSWYEVMEYLKSQHESVCDECYTSQPEVWRTCVEDCDVCIDYINERGEEKW